MFGHSPHSAYYRTGKAPAQPPWRDWKQRSNTERFLTHLMRVGSMGHSGFTNWINKKEKKMHYSNRTQTPYKSVPTHTCRPRH